MEAKISKRQLLEIHPFTATLAENSQKFYGMIWKHGGDFASTVHSAEPVKVRLINGWQDLTSEKLNIVVCNFLYDKEIGSNRTWKELERITGLRREQLVYGSCVLLLIAVLRHNSLTIVHATVVLTVPAVCTLMMLNSDQTEGVRFWMQYWVVYGLMTALGRVLKRSNHDAHDTPDTNWMEIMFFAACLLPSTHLLDVIIACFSPLLNSIKLKFEEYNYCYVS